MRTSRVTRSTTALLVLALAAGALLSLPSGPAKAAAADAPDETWVTNGDVYAVTQVGGKIYLGGSFDQVGPNTGFGVPLDPNTGAWLTSPSFPKVTGEVYVAVPDGSGGWFIGGNFTRVGDRSRQNAARILADGTISPWNPSTDFDVRAIARVGNTVYIGGDFTSVHGEGSVSVSVTGLAATNIFTGAALPSFSPPTPTGGNCAAPPPTEDRTCVTSLAVSADGATLYVGGTFTAPGNHLVAVNATTGVADPTFNPAPDGTVHTLAAASDGRLFVGGSFTTIGGAGQANLAAITSAGAIDPTWGPAANGDVTALVMTGDGTRLYVGGDFTSLGGQGRQRLAALDISGSGSVDASFDPGADGTVSAIALDGARLYAAGSFSTIGGTGRRFLAAMDATSGTVDTNFDARPGAATMAVAVSGGKLFAGGLFTSVNGFSRVNLAALDAASGSLDVGFAADADKPVNAIVGDATSTGIFVGGLFTKVKGEARTRLVHLDALTGNIDQNWRASASAEVKALALAGGHLYVGGSFTTMSNGATAYPRNRLASVTTVTGTVEAWNPDLDSAPYDIDVSPDQTTVYVAGSFSTIGSASRKHLAAISATTGVATAWKPTPGPGKPALAVSRRVVVSADGSRVYVAVAGGDTTGNRVQSYSAVTGAMLWDHKGDGDFQALDLSASLVYAGGHFDNIVDVGQARQHLAAFDQVTGEIQPWGPPIAGVHGVIDLEVNATAILMGGEFRRVNNLVQQGFARFTNFGDAPTPTTTTTLLDDPGTTTTTAPGGGGGSGGGAGGGTPPPAQTRSGYWMVGSEGRVYAFGDARGLGDAPVAPGTQAVDLEPTPSGNGYWVVDSAGHVYAMGDARWLGNVDAGRMAREEKVTSLSSTRSGNGYWIFTTRGRVLVFGDAVAYGDMAATRLNGPVLDSIPTASGRGYYMVASDGGIFSFGDARFSGSMGDKRLNAPVQSLVPDGDNVGYWLVASDGGIFAFDAPFRGSMGNVKLNKPVTSMVRNGSGYLMVGEDGGIFNFSDQPFRGSLGDNPPARPIVSVAALG